MHDLVRDEIKRVTNAKDRKVILFDTFKSMVTVAGPMPVVVFGGSVSIMMATIFDITGHGEVILVLCIAMILMAMVEWAIARRFKEHERMEMRSQQSVLDAYQTRLEHAIGTMTEPLANQMAGMTIQFETMSSTYTSQAEAARATSRKVEELTIKLDLIDTRLAIVEKKNAKSI